MAKAGIGLRVMRYLARAGLLSDRRRLELYPPFLFMRIEVLELAEDWTRVRIRLPLNTLSRNPGGVMFGGWQAALADPIAAMACSRRFPDYSVWTRAMSIDFDRGGSTDLELRFGIEDAELAAIERELAERGRATPTFEYGFHLADGTRCTRVRNTVAIREKGYRKATTGPVEPDEL